MLRTKYSFIIIISIAPYIDGASSVCAIEEYAQQGNYEQAIIQAQQAFASITPQTSCASLFSLANYLVTLGQVEMAIALYDIIIAQRPHYPSALYNKAYTLKMAERVDEAIQLYRRVIEIQPDHEQAHMGLSFAYLTTGNFADAWQESEHNLKRHNINAERLRYFLRTKNLVGKTILLCSQGGLGDSIQYIRYARCLKEHGAHIIVCVQKPLMLLLRNCPYIDELISAGSRYPEHDAFAGLMTLPAVLDLNTENLACSLPYIFPNPTLVEQWKQQLAHDTHFKIGICWHVDSFNDSSRHYVARRSIPFSYFYELARMHLISLYSLQKKDGLEELTHLPNDVHLINFDNFDETHGSFMDTAALIKNLDLVISADTSIAHLAGALGKPVWLLLPYNSDPRWLAGKTDSPWYPTMRIFKQKKPFDWHIVIQEVMRELTIFLAHDIEQLT